MENVSNVSSEEELLQLRNEDKITEAEYQDLLDSLQKATKVHIEPTTPEIDKAKSKRKLGKIAFVLMFVGIIFALMGWAGLALGAATAAGERVEVSTKLVESQGRPITAEDAAERQKDIEQRAVQARAASGEKCMWMYLATVSYFVLGLVFGIAAFVLGVISWPDVFGKATVATISAMLVLALLFAV